MMFTKSTNRKVCPFLKKPCIGSECMLATRIRGTDPNTGNNIDDEACAIAWLPMLLIETTKASHETGAAVESFRNETVKAKNELLTLSAAKLLGADTP